MCQPLFIKKEHYKRDKKNNSNIFWRNVTRRNQIHHRCLQMGLHFISKLKSRGAENLLHWLTTSPSKENWFLLRYLGSYFVAPPCTLLFSAISYDVLGTLYSVSFVKHFVSNYFCINLSQVRAYSLMTISMFFCADKNIDILA